LEGGCHARPSQCTPLAFRGCRLILATLTSSSLLTRRGEGGNCRSWVMVCHAVRPWGATPSLACLGTVVTACPPTSGPRGRRRSLLRIGEPPLPRLRIWEPSPPCALGQPPMSHARLGGRRHTCIEVGRKKLSPSALGLIL
jgi:hypothetical protein